MSIPIVEHFISHENLDFGILTEIPWHNYNAALGLLFGVVDTLPEKFSILIEIFHNTCIDCFSRGFAAIKLFTGLVESAYKVPERQKVEESKLIHDFTGLSFQMEPLIPSIGSLKEALAEVYVNCFNKLSQKFSINDDVIKLAKSAYIYKDTFKIECTLFYFSTEELTKIENWRHSNPEELLRILKKGCDIITQKRYRPSELISIIVFNHLKRCLDSTQFSQSDLPLIDNLLINSVSNYTDKQRGRLKESYIKICDKTGMQPNYYTMQKYDQIQEVSRSVNISAKDEEFCRLGTIRYKGDSLISSSSVNYKPESSSKRYYKKNEPKKFYSSEKNDSSYYEIRKSVGDLISDIRMCLRTGQDLIDPEVIGERLADLCKISEKSAFSSLCYFSYYENHFFKISCNLWDLILQGIELKSLFVEQNIRRLRYYVDYIKDQSNLF